MTDQPPPEMPKPPLRLDTPELRAVAAPALRDPAGPQATARPDAALADKDAMRLRLQELDKVLLDPATTTRGHAIVEAIRKGDPAMIGVERAISDYLYGKPPVDGRAWMPTTSNERVDRLRVTLDLTRADAEALQKLVRPEGRDLHTDEATGAQGTARDLRAQAKADAFVAAIEGRTTFGQLLGALAFHQGRSPDEIRAAVRGGDAFEGVGLAAGAAAGRRGTGHGPEALDPRPAARPGGDGKPPAAAAPGRRESPAVKIDTIPVIAKEGDVPRRGAYLGPQLDQHGAPTREQLPEGAYKPDASRWAGLVRPGAGYLVGESASERAEPALFARVMPGAVLAAPGTPGVDAYKDARLSVKTRIEVIEGQPVVVRDYTMTGGQWGQMRELGGPKPDISKAVNDKVFKFCERWNGNTQKPGFVSLRSPVFDDGAGPTAIRHRFEDPDKVVLFFHLEVARVTPDVIDMAQRTLDKQIAGYLGPDMRPLPPIEVILFGLDGTRSPVLTPQHQPKR